MKICFATNNKKKIEEVKTALDGLIEILSLEDIGCKEELPETGDTLEHNALEKARYVYDNYQVNCFADDTGLEVEALDGAPGVYSGRFAGEPRSDERNMDLLLQKMAHEKNRNAAFRTIIALILEGKEFRFEGKVEGEITHEKSGTAGFGYDPVFLPKGSDKTFGNWTMEEKNRISHRGKAIKKLAQFLLQSGAGS